MAGWGMDDEAVETDSGSWGGGDAVVNGRRGGTRAETPNPYVPGDDGMRPGEAGQGRGFVNPPPAIEPPVNTYQSRGPAGALADIRENTAARNARMAPPPASVLQNRDGSGVQVPDQPGGFTPQEMAEGSVAPWKAEEQRRMGEYLAPSRPAQAKPFSTGQNIAQDLREATDNPVARGAASAFANLGQTGTGLVRLTGDLFGMDSVRDFAAGAEKIAGTLEQGATSDLKGNQKLVADVTASIGVSAPSVALGMIGGPALRTLFVQSALSEYGNGRDAGFGVGESAARAGIYGFAEALGERFGFGEQIRLLKSVTRGMPQGELAQVLGSMIAKEIPGEQLTTAMQFLADKIGPAALNPNATVADYLNAAGETLKVTIAQTAVMGGGPAAINTGRNELAAADRAIDRSAMSLAERTAKDAGFLRPTERRKAANDRLDDFAAEHGITSNAVTAAKKEAEGMPLAEVPGFYKRFMASITRRLGRQADDVMLGALDEPKAPAADETPTAPSAAQNAPTTLADRLGDRFGLNDAPIGAAVPHETAALQPDTGPVPASEVLGTPLDEQAPAFDRDAVENALIAERDSFADVRQKDRTPIQKAIYDAVTASVIDPTDAKTEQMLRTALDNGRRDLADLIVARAEATAKNTSTTPGVSKDSPKYAGIEAALQERKRAADEGAVRLRAMLEAPANKLDDAAHQAATSPLNDLPEPTAAQKQAGNYKVGRVKIDGLDVSIENPKGSIRRSASDAEQPWQVEMPAHYGYIRRTQGADGDHVDLFIGDKQDNGRYWIVNQNHPDGGFDEHKVITGVDSADEAVALYKQSFADGFGDKVFGSVSAEFNADQLKERLPSLKKAKPVIRPRGQQAAGAPEASPVANGVPSAGNGAAPVAPAPSATPRVIARAGRTPNAAQPIELRPNADGTLTPFMEGKAMLDFESGNPITLPAGVSDVDAKKAIRAAGAVSNKTNFFGPAGAVAAEPSAETPAAPAVADQPSQPAPESPRSKQDQRAARARARMALDTTNDTVLQALAKMGGIRRDVVASEFGLKPEELKHTVNMGGLKGFPFRKSGGMALDRALTALREAGYFTGVSDEDARAAFEQAIYNELGGGRELTAAGQMADAQRQTEERALEEEAAARAEYDAESKAEREAIMAEAGVSDDGMATIADDDIDIDAKENTSTEDFMRAMGASEQEIADAIAQEQANRRAAQGNRQEAGHAAGEEARAPAGTRSDETRPGAAEDQGLNLTAPTKAQVLAQQAAIEKEQADREAPADQPRDQRTADQVDLFNTQGSIFDKQADLAPAETPAEAETKPQPRPEELIALRKRASVLKSLLECLSA